MPSALMAATTTMPITHPAVLHHPFNNYTVTNSSATKPALTPLGSRSRNAWLNSSQLVVKMSDIDRDGDLDYLCHDFRGLNVTKGEDFAPFSSRPCYMCRCDRIERDLVHGLMCDEKFCPSCLSLSRPAYDACCAKTCIYMYIAGAAILSMLIGLCIFGVWQNMRRLRNGNSTTAGRSRWLASPIGLSSAARRSNTVSDNSASDGVQSGAITLPVFSDVGGSNQVPSTTTRHQPNYQAFLHPTEMMSLAHHQQQLAALPPHCPTSMPTLHANLAGDDVQLQPPSYWTVLSTDADRHNVVSDDGGVPPSTTLTALTTTATVPMTRSRRDKLDANIMSSSSSPTRRRKQSESPPPRYEDLELDGIIPPGANTNSCSSSSHR